MALKKKPLPVTVPIKAVALWHRLAGMISAVFILVLAITGILINHTHELDLGGRYVNSSALLSWYGMAAPADTESYPVGSVWVTQVGDHLYFDKKQIDGRYGKIIGAVALEDGVVIALADMLLMLDSQGNIVEQLRTLQGLPRDINAIGELDGQLVVRGPQVQYRADKELVRWQPVRSQKVRWASPAAAPEELKASVQQFYRNQMLSMEQVIRDLHNGRILGSWGHWLMDAAALVFIVLAMSGVWLWWRRRESDKQGAKKIHPSRR